MNRSWLLLFILFFSGIGKLEAKEIPLLEAKKGVLDLRNTDLSNTIYSMGGEWAFYWKELYGPKNKPSTPPLYVNFPDIWNDLEINGKPLGGQGYCTYELIIFLPKSNTVIGIEAPDVYSCYNLYTNDTLLLADGKAGATAETSTPFWNTRTARLIPGQDTIRLYLQVANFWHSKGGTYDPIQIGPMKKLVLKRDKEMAFSLILTGCLLMGGLFFLGLYLLGRRDPAILFFSLFCLFYSYRMIGTDRYVLHSLIPSLNWFFTIRMEYVSLTASIAMFTKYTYFLFPEDANKKVVNCIVAFCLGYIAIILFTPPWFFSSLITSFLVVMFFCSAYSIYVYIQAARYQRTGSIYALMGVTLMMTNFVLSNLNYFDLIEPLKGWMFCCYIAFFFLQSLALSHRFAQSFRQATEEAQQGLKTKSEFLSTMSHEIRTPLNAVIGMTHVLLQKQPRKDQQEHLDVLLFSANNLLSIVNNILDYSKIEAGKISFEYISMDINTIVKNITMGLNNSVVEKNINLRLEIDPALEGRVMGDPTRFSQVINNLVHNAIKFTKEGWVCLKLEITASTDTEVTIKVSVEDTGIGIEASKLPIIFERFSQAESSTSRSYGGTGLGLAICKKILQMQGVDLRVKSTLGKGSCFYFTQTFQISQEKALPISPQEHIKQLEGVHILLVEDHPFNVLLAQTILQGWGALVEVAGNGQEALEMLKPSHQIILMDLHMPVMDGYEATNLLRSRGETLPIIALTANTLGEIESGLLNSGLTDIIVKPFNPDDLYQVIVKYLPSSN